MAEPFLGEIKMVGFNFAPKHWAQCDGALLPINQNQSLYSLIGTQFGGDGNTTFALPDMRGRVPVHKTTGYIQGQKGGLEHVTLSAGELAAHTHPLYASANDADNHSPADDVFGDPTAPIYAGVGNLVDMNAGSVTSAGGPAQAHNNMQPIQVINFCIALQGLFPSRN